MQNNNIRALFTLSFLFLCVSSFAGLSLAGDYYIYQDQSGKLVISNTTPPTGSKIIKKQTLSEVTDQEIAESRIRQENTTIDNRIATLERTVDALSDNLRAQNQIIGSLQNVADNNIAVGVTQGGVIRPLRPIDRLPNVPHRPLRPAVPMPAPRR